MDPKLNNFPIGFYNPEKGIHLGQGIYMADTTHSNLIANSTSPSNFVGNLLLAVFKLDVLLVSTITGRGSNRTKGEMVKLKKAEADEEEAKLKEKQKEKSKQEKNDDEEVKSDDEKAKSKPKPKKKKNKKKVQPNDETENDSSEDENEDEDEDTSDNEKEESKQNEKNKENHPKKLDPKLLNACKDYYGHWLEHIYEKEMTIKQAKKYSRPQELRNFRDYATKKISSLKQPKTTSKKKSEIKDPLELNVSDKLNSYESFQAPNISVVMLEDTSHIPQETEKEFQLYDESMLVSSGDESDQNS